MSEDTPRLGLPYLAGAQAQKHVTLNESLSRLDALVQTAALSASVANEPSGAAEGDIYVLPASPSGPNWSGLAAGAIVAFQDGAWLAITPREGWRAWIVDEARELVFDGAAWAPPLAQNLQLLGVNATADGVNRLSIAAAASLFSHEGGGHQLKINKAHAGATASALLQSGFSGRAELGLAGDDHFRVKVSADGAVWKSAVFVDNATGYVALGGEASAARLTLTNNAAAPPAPASGTVLHLAGADGASSRVMFDVFSTAAAAPNLSFRRARGTAAAPSAVQANDLLGQFTFFGYGATAYSGATRAGIAAYAAENWTDTAQGAYFSLMTTSAGAAAVTERVRIAAGGEVGIGIAAPVCKLDIDGPARVKSYAKAGLPAASAGAGQILYVSDDAGGGVLAFSDGAAWRRVTDRAVIA